MKEYEMIYILNPSLNEESIEKEITKVEQTLSAGNCDNIETKKIGNRSLAYEFLGYKNLRNGYYILTYFNANEPKLLKDINKKLRLNESLIRFMFSALKPVKSKN